MKSLCNDLTSNDMTQQATSKLYPPPKAEQFRQVPEVRYLCSLVFEPHDLVLELLNQFRRDKRESNVNVSCTTSASLLKSSAAIPKFPSLKSPQSITPVVSVTKDTKLKVKSFMREVASWISNLKIRIFHFYVKLKTSMSNSILDLKLKTSVLDIKLRCRIWKSKITRCPFPISFCLTVMSFCRFVMSPCLLVVWSFYLMCRLIYLFCCLADLSCHLVYLLCRLVSLWCCLFYLQCRVSCYLVYFRILTSRCRLAFFSGHLVLLFTSSCRRSGN